MAASNAALRKWDAARTFALSLPSAEEDFPWDDVVIKVRTKPGVPRWRKFGEGVQGPMFLWLGKRDAGNASASVKLTHSYDAAVAIAGAAPTTMSGLGQWGWLTVPLSRVEVDFLEDWIEESYRTVAPRGFVSELDARRETPT